jgi:hypothetical protein
MTYMTYIDSNYLYVNDIHLCGVSLSEIYRYLYAYFDKEWHQKINLIDRKWSCESPCTVSHSPGIVNDVSSNTSFKYSETIISVPKQFYIMWFHPAVWIFYIGFY